jgi:hypothetical protein
MGSATASIARRTGANGEKFRRLGQFGMANGLTNASASAGNGPATRRLAGLQYQRRRMWRSSGKRRAWATEKRYWQA